MEHPINGGPESVDVHLERDGTKIACEISIASTDKQELSNVEKCLNFGYDTIIVCAQEQKVLQKIEATVIGQVKAKDKTKLLFMLPEQVIVYLKEQAALRTGSEKWIRGRKVSVNFRPLSEDKERAKTESIVHALVDSIRRRREE